MSSSPGQLDRFPHLVPEDLVSSQVFQEGSGKQRLTPVVQVRAGEVSRRVSGHVRLDLDKQVAPIADAVDAEVVEELVNPGTGSIDVELS